MPSRPKKKKIEIPNDSIEIVDDFNKPLAILNIKDAHRQTLPHRSVIVLVYSPGGQLYLQKRSRNKRLYPGRWDVSASGHVYVGKSLEETAIDELRRELGIKADKVCEIARFNASSQTGNEYLAVFTLEKFIGDPVLDLEEVEDGYFYSKSELEWLIRDFRELLAPALVFLNDQGILFK